MSARFTAAVAVASAGAGASGYDVSLVAAARTGSAGTATLTTTRVLRYRRPRRATVWVHDLTGARVAALTAWAGLVDIAHADADVVRNNLIFAADKTDYVADKATEQRDLTSGLQPLSQEGDSRAPKRVAPDDGKAA